MRIPAAKKLFQAKQQAKKGKKNILLLTHLEDCSWCYFVINEVKAPMTELREYTDKLIIAHGEFDGIILACAGLIRLGFEDRIKQQISAEQSLPAVGQGAVGIEIRENDQMILDLIKPLIDKEATYRVSAERAMNARLEGGCSVPIAGYSTIDGEQITLTGLVGNVDSGVILKHQVSSNIDAVEALGVQLAEKLIEMGAREILK
jgi:hydroxymethylbilane synthase